MSVISVLNEERQILPEQMLPGQMLLEKILLGEMMPGQMTIGSLDFCEFSLYSIFHFNK